MDTVVGEVRTQQSVLPPLLLTISAAIAFCYFEVLQRLGDRTRFLEEQSRLRSLANLLNQVGFQPDMCDDFAEETFTLLRKLSANAPSTDESVLLEAFNDQGVSLSIITHLKVSESE